MAEFEQIKKVYDKLEDKSSKDIYLKRLMFSLSGDNRYIYEMVAAEMERYGRDDIMVCLFEWLRDKDKPIVIFGAGWAGAQIAGVLQFEGKQAACIVDNNVKLWGKKIMGLKICEPEIVAEMKDCLVVIGTNSYVTEIKEQLLDMGIEDERIFVPEKEWWLGSDIQYFDRNIMRAHRNESFIDGGALDGGDSMNFIKWCNGNYDAIYMFEPDADNYQNLVPLQVANNKIAIYEEGLWSSLGKVYFSAGNKENSAISEKGNAVIQVTSIDEKLQGKGISVIKMDIEGSEKQALIGAAKTIRKWKPRLAICVYHKPEDIIEIPLKILELNPEYKFYLRHYSYMDTETVLYAI